MQQVSPSSAGNFLRELRAEAAANRGQSKGALIVVAFRIAHRLRQPLDRRPSPIAMVYGVFYRVLVEWVLGVEIPWRTHIGPRLQVHHGIGIVVNDAAVIGADCVLRQGVTVGNKTGAGPCPVLEDGVDIGANSVVLGGITVGAGAVIGAGSVVVHDVAPHTVVAGNPARTIRHLRVE